MEEILQHAQERMDKTINVLEQEFKRVRAGRANPSILDRVSVDYYGVSTPIQQMAAVSVPEPRILQIQPWDTSTLKEIERAIQTADLGINPQNDGRVIRMHFPPLTEERRRELVKDIKQTAEESKVAVRSIRRDGIEKLKAQKKSAEITEDDLKDMEKRMQTLTDRFCKEVDEMTAAKEKEIMEI